MPTSSPATRLLFLSAGVPVDERALDEVLAAGVDWSELAALAAHENAASVVVQSLGRRVPTGSPSGYRDLRGLAATSLMRMLQLEQVLHRTVDALTSRGIRVMLLKGAALASTAYREFAQRPMNDLDLLVPEDQASAAWEFLQTQGWVWPQARWAAQRYETLHHLPPLLREPGGFRIEVHRHILPQQHPFNFSVDDLWQHARQATRGARHLTVPALTHQLWHVAVHFAWSHGLSWGAWRAFRDTAVIARCEELSWKEFIALAQSTRAGTCCYWTLRLARGLVGADVPDAVLAELRPPRGEGVLRWLERHYVSSFFPSAEACPSLWLTERLWEAGILPEWSGHGRARPWHVGQRWAAGDASSSGRSLWAGFRKLPTVLAYWRRLRQFAPPITRPVKTAESES